MSRASAAVRVDPITVVLLLAAASGLAACGDDFTPRSVVDKTRILAIRASNPRLEPGESTQLSALLVNADGDEARLVRAWEVCAFTQGDDTKYACAWPEDVPQAILELFRGTGETFEFTYFEALASLVDDYCAQQEELVAELPPGITLPDCSSGFPARVRLVATDPLSGEEAIAVKTLYLAPSQRPENYSDNENPAIVELTSIDPGAPVRVDEAHPIRCTVDPNSLEAFVRLHEDVARLEEVQLSWFVRNGRLDEGQTFYSTETGDAQKAQTNEVTPEAPGAVTVWCVIRDGRGGVDWQTLELLAE